MQYQLVLFALLPLMGALAGAKPVDRRDGAEPTTGVVTVTVIETTEVTVGGPSTTSTTAAQSEKSDKPHKRRNIPDSSNPPVEDSPETTALSSIIAPGGDYPSITGQEASATSSIVGGSWPPAGDSYASAPTTVKTCNRKTTGYTSNAAAATTAPSSLYPSESSYYPTDSSYNPAESSYNPTESSILPSQPSVYPSQPSVYPSDSSSESDCGCEHASSSSSSLPNQYPTQPKPDEQSAPSATASTDN